MAKRQALANRVCGMAKEFIRVNPKWAEDDHSGYYIPDELEDEIEDLCGDVIAEECWTDAVSRQCARKAFTECISGVARSGGSTETVGEIDKTIAAIRSKIRPTNVYVPLPGLQLDVPSVRIGRVFLSVIDGDTEAKLKEEVEAIVRGTMNTPDQKTAFARSCVNEIDTRFRGVVCGQVAVCAEPQRAREVADRECQRAIEILRFAAGGQFGTTKHFFDGLPGEIASVVKSVFVVAPGYELFWPLERVGPLAPLGINQSFLESMDKCGTAAAARWLENGSPTDVQAAILQAIHWAAESQKQSEPEFEFLTLMIALETLLGRGQGATHFIAEGVAFLLGGSADQRRSLFKEVKAMYHARSEIAHGVKASVSPGRVQRLARIVRGVVYGAIERSNELATLSQLHCWVDDQKFG